MPKVLTAARVRVPPTNEADYLATLRELCQFADARGQRIWLFRNAKDPQLFTEFWRCGTRSEEHTSELQSRLHIVCRLLLEKKKNLRHHTRRAPEAGHQTPDP